MVEVINDKLVGDVEDVKLLKSVIEIFEFFEREGFTITQAKQMLKLYLRDIEDNINDDTIPTRL